MRPVRDLAAVIASLFLLQLASAEPAETSALQRLLAQNEAILRETKAVTKRDEDIGKAKLELEGVDAVLKRAEASLRRNVSGLEQEAQMWQQQAERTNNNGCPWGGEAETPYANACNAELRKVEAWAQELKGKENGVAEYARRLAQERQELSNNTERWGKKKAIVNRDMRLIEQKREQWQRAFNNFVFKSDAYERLKQMDVVARNCPNATGGSAQATDCLRHLWENSR